MHAAADRAINQRNAFLSKPRRNALHGRAADGGHFDIGAHTTRRGSDTASAQCHPFGNFGTRQAGENHLASRSNGNNGINRFRAGLRSALHRFWPRIKYQNALTGIALRPIRHARCNRAAHGAKPQKTNHAFSHCHPHFATLASLHPFRLPE